MAAIGSVWATGTWADDVWAAGTWADLGPTTAPGVPTGLVAVAGSATRINLSWVAPVDDGGSPITGYLIESESPTGNGFSTLVADTGTTLTLYSDTGLANTTEWNYRVSAINAVGTSSPSNESADTTLAASSFLSTDLWRRRGLD